MTSTQQRLLDATVEVLHDEGITGMSARAIASRAGANQALIFYHFGTLSALIETAYRGAVDASLDLYRAEFAAVTTLVELLDVGRRLHERESESGNVTMMAQLMAGARRDDALAAAARYGMQVWTAEIETVVQRVLAPSPVREIADPAGLARAVSAAFIGLELYDGVDSAGAVHALDALERLGVLVEVVDDLGPVARRALRAKVRRRSAGQIGRPLS